jgi:hypothetical protein
MFSLLIALLAPAAEAAEDNWKISLEGYYRTRGYIFSEMGAEQDGMGNFMAHRLRLQPEINFQDRAKVIFQADLLDDVVWGDNSSIMPAAVFSQDPGFTRIEGQDVDLMQRSTTAPMIKRAWLEFKVPVGLVRIGRQESHWGAGILSNHGNGFDDTFGENHYGSTFDRAIFATRPVSIAQTIMGRDVTDFPLIMAVGVDRLVEDPLHIYYGYQCNVEDPAGNIITQDASQAGGTSAGLYDPRCDQLDSSTQTAGRDGIHDTQHDYIDESRTPSQRDDLWWADRNDDAWEMVYLALYKGENVDLFGAVGDLTIGAYVIDRKHVESDSRVGIYDAYFKFLRKGLYLESEVVNIRGKSSGLALPGTYDPASKLPNPLYKDIDIWGWLARAGYQRPAYTLMMESGFSSGDDNVADSQFTGRPLHPDFNVGLLLYEEVLARVTSRTWSPEAFALWSNGGVWNSYYIFPNVRVRPMDNWEFSGAYLLAWPHLPDGSRILCQESDGVQCDSPAKEELAQEIGWEVDFAVKHRFHEHLNFTMETAYAQVSNRIPLENLGLNPDGKFFTFQSRIAYEF